MLDKVYKYIIENKMINNGDSIILGVSGGADSMCLLVILNELKKYIDMDLHVVHIEHGIRGQESLEDALFVKENCEKLGVSFKQYSYDVIKLAKKEGLTTEEMGRKLRYEAFYEALKEYKAEKIAVAHNMNDNCETVFLNMTRGSGLKGIHGIVPKRDNIIRPLLCLERSDIEKYLKEKNIDYRTDSTNLSEDYSRNKIRLNVIPELNKVNEKLCRHVFDLSETVRKQEAFIEKNMMEIVADCVKFEKNAAIIDLKKTPGLDEFIFSEMILYLIGEVAKSRKDISRKHVEIVMDLCLKKTGKSVELPYGISARKEYDYLIIEKKIKELKNLIKNVEIELEIKENQPKMLLNGAFKWEIIKKTSDYVISKEKYIKDFDADKIQGKLVLRNRKSGDFIYIDDKGHKKKLKDYFINEKVPRTQRDEILLLARGNEIIWIIGMRSTANMKVGEDTKNILRISYRKKDI
ncbi:tRNA(Ile)-lysidine synthase [Acetitomaculum ruminis DSM 5522]|uniref:tRNA(Ile)-lysidine synthase n=1 Tax=Acetitomaculum ruminis DSM 5522 TaxID=1120918 RepID=A0A1I0W2L0_9FIRM|nr:tRNA lysidine(34) synthetase TilS [Acetitomaculum ruminis]SFA82568.1 tRNA(Ile)-lysidine synthase [Acetitomaculum ruminis DSM 5522]